MAAAVVPELRLGPDVLHRFALRIAAEVSTVAGSATGRARPPHGVRFRLLLVRLADYLGRVLSKSLPEGKQLARARLTLVERVAPLSLYLAAVRVSMDGRPLMDVLYDTSDAEPDLAPIAHVVFDPGMLWLLSQASWLGPYGTQVRAVRGVSRARIATAT